MASVIIVQALASMLFGALLGGFFFGGLWWSIRQMTISTWPNLLMILSFAFRMVLVLLGFYLLTRSGVSALAFALVGFFVARYVIAQRVRNLSWGRSE